MKKVFFTLILLTLISPLWSKAKYTFVKPDKSGRAVKIRVKGKDWTYYKLNRKNPLEFFVEGPTEVKVITRLDMEKFKRGAKVDYTVYCDKNQSITHFTRSAVLSRGIKFSSGDEGRIGAARSFNIEIPVGKHKIKLYLLDKDKNEIYLRLMKKGAAVKEKSNRVAMTPQKYSTMVKILVKESEFDYYRIGDKDSLTLKVIGPATVKVLSRLEYDITMNGDKKYRIQVTEDGKLKNTFLLNTILSNSAVYAKLYAEKSLSRAEQFSIEVPPGQHFYNFKVLDSGRSALLKFYIDIKALKNTF
jgi:hypothetical protein